MISHVPTTTIQCVILISLNKKNSMFVLMLSGMSNGLNICVCKRTRDGIYKGQLVKVESSLNGGN